MGLSVLASIYFGTNPAELAQCFESLIAQTRPADEVIIVIDGPVATSVNHCLDRYRTILPIRRIPFSQNRGLGPALHHGLIECNHELIARVDTDDRSVPARFETQVQFLKKHPAISVIGGMMREHSYFGAKETKYVRSIASSHEEIRQIARKRNPINHPTVVFRKDDILACGNYLDYPFFEDYELWARVISNGYLLSNIDQILVETTTNSDFFSRRCGPAYIKHELRLARRLHTLGVLDSLQLTRFILTRIPLRLAPPSLMELFYRKALRTKEQVSS